MPKGKMSFLKLLEQVGNLLEVKNEKEDFQPCEIWYGNLPILLRSWIYSKSKAPVLPKVWGFWLH